MNTALEYSTRVVQEAGRRCKKSTLNDLVHLTPLRIPLMNPPYISKLAWSNNDSYTWLFSRTWKNTKIFVPVYNFVKNPSQEMELASVNLWAMGIGHWTDPLGRIRAAAGICSLVETPQKFPRNTEAVDMNGRFQMQGGKNWILPK